MQISNMTLPQNVINFCPKCGSEDFPFQGEKSFKCSHCGFQFFINSAAAVAAIIENDNNEIMLTYRAFEPGKGMLDLPGGFVDPNESLEQALEREIKEELNLEITDMTYITSLSNQYVFSKYTVYTTDAGFLCKITNFNNLVINDDVSEIAWFSKENIPWNKIHASSIKEIIKAYFNQK